MSQNQISVIFIFYFSIYFSSIKPTINVLKLKLELLRFFTLMLQKQSSKEKNRTKPEVQKKCLGTGGKKRVGRVTGAIHF